MPFLDVTPVAEPDLGMARGGRNILVDNGGKREQKSTATSLGTHPGKYKVSRGESKAN